MGQEAVNGVIDREKERQQIIDSLLRVGMRGVFVSGVNVLRSLHRMKAHYQKEGCATYSAH